MMYLREYFQAESEQVWYLLALICLAMVVDFFSGVVAAKINKKIIFHSQKGINGILRKVASMVLLIFFIPLAGLIPANAGSLLLYVLYGGYLFMEIQSILENYQKMGIQTELFQNMLQQIMEFFRNK